MTSYAISLADLTALKQAQSTPVAQMFLLLLQPHLSATVVEAERGKVGGMGDAVLLACPAEQAAAIAQIVKTNRPNRSPQPRIYRSETGNGGWKRI